MGLKIPRPQGHPGSSPGSGTSKQSGGVRTNPLEPPGRLGEPKICPASHAEKRGELLLNSASGIQIRRSIIMPSAAAATAAVTAAAAAAAVTTAAAAAAAAVAAAAATATAAAVTSAAAAAAATANAAVGRGRVGVVIVRAAFILVPLDPAVINGCRGTAGAEVRVVELEIV